MKIVIEVDDARPDAVDMARRFVTAVEEDGLVVWTRLGGESGSGAQCLYIFAATGVEVP